MKNNLENNNIKTVLFMNLIFAALLTWLIYFKNIIIFKPVLFLVSSIILVLSRNIILSLRLKKILIKSNLILKSILFNKFKIRAQKTLYFFINIVSLFILFVILIKFTNFLILLSKNKLVFQTSTFISVIILISTGFFSLLNSRMLKNDKNSVFLKNSIISFHVFLSLLSFYLSIHLILTLKLKFYYGEILSRWGLLLLLFFQFTLLLELLFIYLDILKEYILNKVETEREELFFLSLFFSSASLKKSFNNTINNYFGLDLSSIKAFKYMTNIFEILLLASIIIFWVMTSVFIVKPEENAIIYRFGKAVNSSVNSGIHFKYPYPVDIVKFYKAYEIKEANIGFTPDPDQKHILWTKSHAKEVFNVVTGNGTEIISIDMQLLYRIKKLDNYVFNSQNPSEIIKAEAYNTLLEHTVSSTFDEIMVRDRIKFANILKNELQEKIDTSKLGIDIIDLTILAMHPPIEVGFSYEDVISAQIEKKTNILDARTDNYGLISLAKSEYISNINLAKSYSVLKLASVKGESTGFLSRLTAFKLEPELEAFRLKLEKKEKLLKTKQLFIIDKSLMKTNDKFLLNVKSDSGGRE